MCESPTYLAAISAFRMYGCKFIEVPTDKDGMKMDALESLIQNTKNIKVIYAIPDFQNPTGRTWSLERRKQLAAISDKYKIILLEDNPYGELRFEGESISSIQSFCKQGYGLCMGTFSKILCPGYRIGWIAGDDEIIKKYVLVKQGTDLQCNTTAQMEIAKYLELYDIDEHIDVIKKVYKARRDLAVQTMQKEFPTGVVFNEPEGGLFTWVELPAHINAREVLEKCLEKNVAFVPGGSFFPNGGHENTFRINFSNMPEERITKGLGQVGEVLRSFM